MISKKPIQARSLTALLVVLGAYAATIAEAADVYIPRTSIHFKCEFPDGSYTEYKERQKWFFYAEPIPHAQTRASLDSTLKYVDSKGKDHKYVGTREPTCIGVGKRNGRLFWGGGFENLDGQFVNWTARWNQSGVTSPLWENLPREVAAGTVDQTPAMRKFMDEEFLYGGYRALVLPLHSDETLLFEQPLTALENPSFPYRTVLYVYQSISTDYGKTWSAPIITKDAKLFEIGRLLTEQSWSAKVKTIVEHR